MRQLDLFSSLFDSPPAEEEKVVPKKQAEQVVVKEKEIEKVEATEAFEENAEAENQPAETVALSFNETVIEKEEIVIEEVSPDSIKEESTPLETDIDKEEKKTTAFFEDENIGVRLKQTSTDTPENKVENKPLEKPIEKASATKSKQKKKKEKVKKAPQKRGRKSYKEIDAELDLVNVPDDEILFQKQYYGISEVAGWFAVNTSLLRFWENEFDVLKPRKNRKGDRLFRPEDVKNLQLIYQLLRQRKYTIEGAKEYIKSHKKKADMQLQLTTTLKKFKGFLLELKSNLQ